MAAVGRVFLGCYPPPKSCQLCKENKAMKRINIIEDKTFSKSFTTKPKLRRLTFHRQSTVRNRACALQESFYPTKDVPYNAVKVRMVTLLGIVDRMSVLAYLGRPKHIQQTQMEQTVRYLKSGATVPKRHYFKRKLAAKKGYIELFNLGYVYSVENEWRIHWNHTTQLTLPDLHECVNSPAPPTEISERVEVFDDSEKASKEDFSLSYNTLKGNKYSTPNNPCEHGIIDRMRRERYSIRERNCESENNRQNFIVQHSEKAKLNGKKESNLSPEELRILKASRRRG